MKLVFLVEEQSMKELLTIILPKILPNLAEMPRIIHHNGKSDLQKSIPIKLKAWLEPDVKFIIIHDQDSNDCMLLKEKLKELCKVKLSDCLIRIACKELESWYFGDLTAVSLAYNKDIKKFANKKKYRIPDNINNPKDELRKEIPQLEQIDGARKIGENMDINNNTSRSFNIFIDGLRNLI